MDLEWDDDETQSGHQKWEQGVTTALNGADTAPDDGDDAAMDLSEDLLRVAASSFSTKARRGSRMRRPRRPPPQVLQYMMCAREGFRWVPALWIAKRHARFSKFFRLQRRSPPFQHLTRDRPPCFA